MKTPLGSYTCLAFVVNRVIEAAPAQDLSYKEIFDAAREGRLIGTFGAHIRGRGAHIRGRISTIDI